MKKDLSSLPIEVQEAHQLRITGDVSPKIWNRRIGYFTFKGRWQTDRLAIAILAQTVFYYRPDEIRDPLSGAVVGYKKRFSGEYLQRSYDQLAVSLCCTEEQAKDSVRLLEELKIIQRVVQPYKKDGPDRLYIRLRISVLKMLTHDDVFSFYLVKESRRQFKFCLYDDNPQNGLPRVQNGRLQRGPIFPQGGCQSAGGANRQGVPIGSPTENTISSSSYLIEKNPEKAEKPTEEPLIVNFDFKEREDRKKLPIEEQKKLREKDRARNRSWAQQMLGDFMAIEPLAKKTGIPMEQKQDLADIIEVFFERQEELGQDDWSGYTRCRRHFIMWLDSYITHRQKLKNDKSGTERRAQKIGGTGISKNARGTKTEFAVSADEAIGITEAILARRRKRAERRS